MRMQNISLLLVTVLIMCFVGGELFSTGTTQEDMDNITSQINYDTMNFSFNEEGNNKNNTGLQRAIYKGYDFFALATLEVGVRAINFGYNHPQYNFELAWKLLFFSIFAILLKPLIILSIFIAYLVIFIKNKIDKLLKNKRREGNK